jgi:hypothetical protein
MTVGETRSTKFQTRNKHESNQIVLLPFSASCLMLQNFLRISSFVLCALFFRKQGESYVF